MKVLLAGGGTGGHTAPLLAVISEIKRAYKKGYIDFLFITPDEYFKAEMAKAGVKTAKIQAGKLRRYIDAKNVADVFKVLIGIAQSVYYVARFKPDVVFSKGGFASVPPVFASWLMGIPIITHESDMVPGLANRINAFFAKNILLSFPESVKYFSKKKVVIVGNPIREDISCGNAERGKKYFGFSENLPVILLFGGSQGARTINLAVLDALSGLLEEFNILHICGEKNFAELMEEVRKKNIANAGRYKLYPFLHSEMKDAYAVSNIIVSRAGANSISEIIEIGKPSIIIPLSSAANRHQEGNAEWLAKAGMAEILSENNLSGKILHDAARKLILDKKTADRMRYNIRLYKEKMGKNPAKKIAEIVIAAEKR